ncbi:hypothetical protein ACWOFR_04700 [Carnobacterium gallinarum]|uniref:hypothetical protein n=1 Tax=Carnobacterium gallinarum TaxID=2749 RepID=UPI000558D568|nr:hypothetical protein [Carnobacterium gallinarum]
MKTNLTKREAYTIANEYIEKYKLTKNLSTDSDECVVFYENVFGIIGYAWVVAVKYPASFMPDEFDETSYFISDESKQVEFVIGHGGVYLTNHLTENDTGKPDEWDLLDEDFYV